MRNSSVLETVLELVIVVDGDGGGGEGGGRGATGCGARDDGGLFCCWMQACLCCPCLS